MESTVVPDMFVFSLTEPPGPIDNSKIALTKAGGHMHVKQGKACAAVL